MNSWIRVSSDIHLKKFYDRGSNRIRYKPNDRDRSIHWDESGFFMEFTDSGGGQIDYSMGPEVLVETDGAKKQGICPMCESVELFSVTFDSFKKNGIPWRKGTCTKCGHFSNDLCIDIDFAEWVMPFGKHKGTKLLDIPSDYINWALENMDLNVATRLRFNWALDNESPLK